MILASTIVRWVVRLGALVQVGLGLLFWTGNQLQLIPVHMLVGMLVVLGLVVLAVLGAFARVGWARMVLAIVWAPIVVWLGLNQTTLLPDQLALHEVVRTVHLLVGLAAVAQAEMLAGAIVRRRAAVAAPAGGVA